MHRNNSPTTHLKLSLIIQIGNFSLLAILLGGCGLSSDVVHEVTPQIVSAGLDAANQPENKKHLSEIASSTIVNAAVVDVHGEIIDTLLARLAAKENEENVRQIVQHVTRAVSNELSAPQIPALQQKKDALVVQSSKLVTRAAVEELKMTLPALITNILSNPDIQRSVAPVTRSAASEAAKGVGDAVVDKH